MKKCVIIGSGLGGLSCGVILAKNGYHVTVLEQANQIGGCLQCFRRGDALFDTGMHYIGSAAPGQTLHTLWRFLGVDQQVPLSQLDPNGYDVIALQGKHYPLANGKENFINTLADYFPHSRQELARYCDLVKQVALSAPMHTLNGSVDSNVYAQYLPRSVNQVIDSIITDPSLRQVLAGILPLYAGEKDHTPFTTHALIADFYSESAFRIVGGSSILADALKQAITDMGGQVLTHQKVVKIECNDQQATAVHALTPHLPPLTSHLPPPTTETFPAHLVISTIHPAATIQLIDSSRIRPAYRHRIQEMRNTISAFTVYLKFKKDTVRYMNHNLYYYRGDTTWGCENYNESTWPKALLYMHFCHNQQPPVQYGAIPSHPLPSPPLPSHPFYAQTGQIIAYMRFDEVSRWQHTHIEARGEAYEAFKRQKAETLIRALEEEVPGIGSCIDTYYTSTPLTYQHYTSTPQGTMYGLAKDVNLFASGNMSPRTSIPNLLLAGQSIASHGMLGVLAGSLLACSEVIPREELFRQLHEASNVQ